MVFLMLSKNYSDILMEQQFKLFKTDLLASSAGLLTALPSAFVLLASTL